MLRRQIKENEEAQVFLEYVIVVGVIVLIMFAMGKFITRGSQGMIKIVADQIGNQINAEQRFDAGGYLQESYTSTRSNMSKTKSETPGETTYSYGDSVVTDSTAVINMGFAPEQ